MQKDKGDRHRYGRHYTPEHVARLLAALAVRSPADLVFDPSCGDGRLLKKALERKLLLEAKGAGLNPAGTAVERPGRPFFARSRQDIRSRELFGIDQDAAAVQRAAATGAQVACADFFDLSPAHRLNEAISLPAELDAVIGNPPYIRQEVMGAADKRRIALRLSRSPDDSIGPGIYWPRWSGRSDIYVYFFAHSASFLRPGGRLVFITASSWLDVGYGEPLQQFFLNNFRIVAVIESAVESFFEDASVNTAITVLEREPDRAARDENEVRFVQLLGPLADACGDAAEFASYIERSDRIMAPGKLRIRTVTQRKMGTGGEPEPGAPLSTESQTVHSRRAAEMGGAASSSGSKWGRYLRADDLFFNIIERGEGRWRRLSELARVRFGVKTGANEFFYVTTESETSRSAPDRSAGSRTEMDPKRAPYSTLAPVMLPLEQIASVRRGLTTGANEYFYVRAVEKGGNGRADQVEAQSSGARGLAPRDSASEITLIEDGLGVRHVIESKYLSPVIFSLKEIPGIVIKPGQSSRMFFNCAASPDELQGSAALAYIQAGERAGYNSRPSCATRNLWYAIARDRSPAPIIFPSKVGERWVVALNDALVYEDKKLYGVFPQPGVPRLALAALMNSTWARYYAEMTCRQMTGAQAIADIDVAVAEQIRLPDPRGLAELEVERLESALSALAARPVISLFEEVKLTDRRRLDGLVLEAVGFRDESERENVLDQLYEAAVRLVRYRLARSRNSSI